MLVVTIELIDRNKFKNEAMKRVYSDYDIQVYRLFKKYKRQQMRQINVEYAKTIRIELFTLETYTYCGNIEQNVVREIGLID